jgi:tetratricopeptide (TPR) repeat protein
MLEAPLVPTDSELMGLISQLSWTGNGNAALQVFRNAKEKDMKDPGSWFKLGMTLFDGGYYSESFEAFDRYARFDRKDTRHFGAVVWMGHLKDLLGEREEALRFYRLALTLDTGQTMQYSQYNMRLDRAWVEARIKIPFKR